MRKAWSLALVVILVASSLLWAESTFAQTIPKPSVPEFTVQYVVDSYDVPPTYQTNPYTGASEVASPGYHLQNNSLQIKIKNQPFTVHTDSRGNLTQLYYAVAYKGHYEDIWQYKPSYALEKGVFDDPMGSGVRGSPYLKASSSEYTVISLDNWDTGKVPDGGQIDIQVQALIGYDNVIVWGHSFVGSGDWVTFCFEGDASDWSPTKTITISETSATASPTTNPPAQTTPTPTPSSPPNPTATPIQPQTQTNLLPQLEWEQVAIIVLVGVVVALVVGMVLLWRRIPR